MAVFIISDDVNLVTCVEVVADVTVLTDVRLVTYISVESNAEV